MIFDNNIYVLLALVVAFFGSVFRNSYGNIAGA